MPASGLSRARWEANYRMLQGKPSNVRQRLGEQADTFRRLERVTGHHQSLWLGHRRGLPEQALTGTRCCASRTGQERWLHRVQGWSV